MHSLVFKIKPKTYGNGRMYQIDHKDRNGLNNRKSNLRLATDAEQRRNMGLSILNKSGFKGVTPIKKKWRATIVVDNKSIYIGSYSTKEEAAKQN